ncbi:MAG: hypothetical protein OQJ89_08110 [Kangiellaceae bacterium]|nr:hypothetical protein [Kangiellaceae bacterium]MCW9016911.1 hypothetical protein [Kangiellaceae bacterium]
MQIDAIGASLGSQSATSNNVVSQDDFIKLFLAQLTFQDPLEPINNEQFLAQMAQFANLEQSRQIHESLEQQSFMQASDQALSMIGKTVEVATSSGNVLGTISAISFSQSGATLTVTQQDNTFISDVRLSQVRLITE